MSMRLNSSKQAQDPVDANPLKNYISKLTITYLLRIYGISTWSFLSNYILMRNTFNVFFFFTTIIIGFFSQYNCTYIGNATDVNKIYISNFKIQNFLFPIFKSVCLGVCFLNLKIKS